MSALYISFHRWNGFALTNAEPDLFHVVFRLGFCTVYVCKRCLLTGYRRLKDTMQAAVWQSEQLEEGR